MHLSCLSIIRIILNIYCKSDVLEINCLCNMKKKSHDKREVADVLLENDKETLSAF